MGLSFYVKVITGMKIHDPTVREFVLLRKKGLANDRNLDSS